MLVIDQITRCFGARKVLDTLSFDVAPGEIVGLLGPNGAGKTTLLRTIGGVLEPTTGDIRFNGQSTFPPLPAVRKLFGFVPEEAPLYNEMTVLEFLKYRSRLKGYSGRRLSARLRELTEAVGIGDILHLRCGALSSGQRRRTALADALITHPQVLLLDALLDNIDVLHVRQIHAALLARTPRSSILISGHNLHALLPLCTRFMTLRHGRCTATFHNAGDPAELLERLTASVTEQSETEARP